jgi:hypothetical protein
MNAYRISRLLLAALSLAATAPAHSRCLSEAAGPLVAVSVEVGGHPADLFPAPDGSGRYYLEARQGAPYLIHLANRSGERLGVVLTVDGLNAISGAPDEGRGRMYVLDPWGRATVRGWRTSLQEVRRFTFVDEEASYAARTNQASSRMGWVEVSVYRERGRWMRGRLADRGAAGERSRRNEAAPAPAEPAADAAESESRPQAKSQEGARARSYPGTGWGSRSHDPVVLVHFEPAHSASQRTTLRYEYRDALVALGVLPSPHDSRDRLAERDRGMEGFAPPPLW